MDQISKPKVRVLLIGSGGVGTMTSYALESGGQAEVTAVLRSNYDIVEQSGFSINSLDHGKEIHGWRPTHIRRTIPDHAKENLKPFDYIVVTTKNIPDVPPLLANLIRPAVTLKHSTIVLIQNGLNIEKPFVEQYPDNVVLSGVQLMGVEETQPGIILHNEPDNSKIGYFPNDRISTAVADAAARRFVGIYNACGKVKCAYDEDVRYTRWRKLMYNSSYNAVAAILQMDVTRMRAYEHIIDELVRPAMLEIQAIAHAAVGVKLPDNTIDYFITVDSAESWFMPSMGQDAIKGNLMEFENIVGEPLREAKRVGVPCPTLQMFYSTLKGLQAKVKEARGLIQPEFTEGSRYHHGST